MKIKAVGNLNSYIIDPTSGEQFPESVVILVHGYGANGRDLIGLGAEWAPHCPDTAFISPDAPQLCEATPLGQQWFSLEDFSVPSMEKQIITAWETLSDYIDQVIEEFKVPEQKIVLCGFSQGTMMALYTALNRKNNCAGILGYSGVLLGMSTGDIPVIKKSLAIHLIHGSADTVVPVDAWESAMAFFKDNKFKNVTGHKSKGLGHNIDMNGMESGLYFIRECLYQ
jgi:phospholipase/carboxylesterase